VSGNIFWSADSRSLAFVADNYLKTIEVSGREIRTLTEVEGNIGGGTWNSDGVIIYSRFLGGLHRIAASGGTSTPLTKPSGSEGRIGVEGLHLAPSLLPDGRHFIYVVVAKGGNVARVATLEGSTVSEFPIPGGSSIVYAPPLRPGQSGHFLVSRGATLLAQPADARTFTPSGQPVQVADDLAVAAAPGSSPTFYSVSSTGTLVYLAGDIARPTHVTWFDRTGKEQATVWSRGIYNDVALSPDDTRVALTMREPPNQDDIWIVDLERNVPTKFTFDRAQDWHPVWSPDGKRLAFSSTRVLGGTGNSVFLKEAINVATEQLVLKSTANDRVNDWSPDGKRLLINRTQGRDGLFVVPIDSGTPATEDKVTTYLNSPNYTETRGQFYPIAREDGRSWIVYTSNESGEYEVYVESYPRGTLKEHVSTKGGTQPRWRRDGKELFYISPDLKLMAVDVTAGETLTFGPPRELFQTRMSLGGTLAYRMLRYDVTRDGKRFLINSEREGAEPTSPPITVVLNWQESLNR
jgi:hypothetical protein